MFSEVRRAVMTPLWIAMVPVVVGAIVLGLAAICGFISSLHGLLAGEASAEPARDA